MINPEDLKAFGFSAFKVVAIVLGAGVAVRFGGAAIDGAFVAEQAKAGLQENRRIQTLKALVRSILMYAVYFIAGLMVLDTFGVPTGSLIASAGLASLAIGFGAQNLVRDVITGFFIVFEDQFTVGDYITTAGVTGVVEELGLRTTRIREWTGQLHIVPNGEINKVTNFNRGHMLAVVTINVPYEADLDRAMEVLRRACENAHQELPAVVAVPVVQGVVELGDAGVVVRVIAQTLAGEQWGVERELRKRLKVALESEGLHVAYPRHVVVHGLVTGD
ncbi:hypothetical protein SY88_01750 [Clostridiales bacterium PH28_bin88]|nr:hypothetical protein SY88_01750 [Clostridiales bacterium PH28_bin88]